MMEYNTLFKDLKSYAKLSDDEIKEFTDSSNIDEFDGMHVWFGMVVVPLIEKFALEKKSEKLKLIFEYLEAMASSSDENITEVLEFTVLEDLISSDNNIIETCKKYMGEETLKSYENVKKYVL